MKIGFIGVGVMGSSMVKNLLKKAYAVEIYARHPEKVKEVVQAGATLIPSIATLAAQNELIITMVGFPKDVESIYFDDDKILNHAKAGTIMIDMTTSSPSLAQKIAQAAKTKGLYSLDCPVTGGDIGAKEGTLTIFGGGDEAVFKQVRPILEAMGKTIVYVGQAGMGQHAKLANQIGVAGAMAAVAEMMAYGRAKGLNLEQLIPIWNTGSAASTQLKVSAPRALANNFQPGFYIKHFIKDMKLAISETENLDLKMLHTVLKMYEKLASEGCEDLGTQALVKFYE
ncbi:MAG TPA: NAD(P)-dependent oxidoreductase [Bacilli bacterium]|mgnify:CR=1 FL=1|nr:MAG: 2-hydroxy-3-oxopropionate reductase [Tenericutes bacterium ADurb.BinA124]HPN61094.1 NAD(P)-dependent oxidoreductase [Bacilli bacterium]HPX83895.1 NAD(P)-dependent oxidoreductase [Bacilli bacterium]HQC74753.1 NAD(P)-dependent oxidoreductase [Bacilli bacterium]